MTVSKNGLVTPKSSFSIPESYLHILLVHKIIDCIMAIKYYFVPYKRPGKIDKQIQHGRYLENWYLEAGRDLGTSEADTEVGDL